MEKKHSVCSLTFVICVVSSSSVYWTHALESVRADDVFTNASDPFISYAQRVVSSTQHQSFNQHLSLHTATSTWNHVSLMSNKLTTVNPSESTTEQTAYPSESSTEQTAYPSESSTEQTAYPSESTTGQTAYPSESTTEQTAYPSESSTEQTAYPSESTTEQTAYPSESTTEQTAYPSESSTEQTAYPSESSTEQTAYPSESSTEQTAYPSESTTEQTAYPSESTTEQITYPSESTTEQTAYPSENSTGQTENTSTARQETDKESDSPSLQELTYIYRDTPCNNYKPVRHMKLLTRSAYIVEIELRNVSESGSSHCWLYLEGPEGAVLSVLLLRQSCVDKGQVRVVEHIGGQRGRTWQSCQTMISPGADYLTPANRIYVGFTMKGNGTYTATLNVIVTDKRNPDQLQLRYVSAHQEMNTYSYRDHLKIKSSFAVPRGHVVFISVAVALFGRQVPDKVCEDRLELHQGLDNDTSTVWTLCSGYRRLPRATIVNNSDVTVRFFSGTKLKLVDSPMKNGCGFRLLFSFHQPPRIPSALPEKKWNCSVSFWPDFRQHFWCNLITECSQGQDERECPYTLCGDKSVALAGKCYSLHDTAAGLSWHQANGRCAQSGGRLAALKTKDILNGVGRGLRLDLVVKNGHLVLVGVRTTDTDIFQYRNTHEWTDRSVTVESFKSKSVGNTFTEFGYLFPFAVGFLMIHLRTEYQLQNDCSQFDCKFVCERDMGTGGIGGTRTDGAGRAGRVIIVPLNDTSPPPFPYTLCPSGHLVHAFLAFDTREKCHSEDEERPSDCDSSQSSSSASSSLPLCRLHVASFPVPFTCANSALRVSYSLVCDHVQDCQDNSDENFCIFQSCDFRIHFLCKIKEQCLPRHERCDGIVNCMDGSDESACRLSSRLDGHQEVPSAPYVVKLDTYDGHPELKELVSDDDNSTNEPRSCPSTHFRCPVEGNCFPMFSLCNGLQDCSQREDEMRCEDVACPGYYKCRGSPICLHPDHLCDRQPHCPNHDDELFCNLACPEACSCFGFSFTCRQPFLTGNFTNLRYLNAVGSGMKILQVVDNAFLIYLNLSVCDIGEVTNVSLRNLIILDLSYNRLETVNMNDLYQAQNLQKLYMSGNPLSAFLASDHSARHGLKQLDLSHTKFTVFRSQYLMAFQSLEVLNLSNSKTDRVQTGINSTLPKTLRVLDARGCSVTTFPRTLFEGLNDLQQVYANNFKLCCPAMLPDGFNQDNCHAPFDEISSCEDLLRSDIYRIPLWILATFAMLGNFVSFLARVTLRKGKAASFGIFVLHLCFSDFLMGVYLIFIGVADKLYQDRYLWEDIAWRHSTACEIAGFMSMMSCEVSAFIICLITVDRFLVLRFPFSRLRLGFRSAQTTAGLAWVTGCVLAAVPLLPATSHWQFYSQTGICIPLPVTRNDFAGHSYAFGVIIVVNFVLFMLIATGQASVYVTIQSGRMSGPETSSRKSQDATIARRLVTIVLTDFLCWFPIGFLGLLASSGTPIPGEVNVALAIFVLPLNSALNPFLYTLNMLQERMQAKKEDQLFQKILQQKTSA